MSRSWLEELEAQLEDQLEGFLRANPRQEALLAEQEARDRQLSLRQERLVLQQQAEAKRQRLLELAQEIRLWQQRRDKASAAGAADLATKAAAHLADLMEQGRGDWQSLTDLGQRFASVEAALDALNHSSGPARAASAAAPGDSGRTSSSQPPRASTKSNAKSVAKSNAPPGAKPSGSGNPKPGAAQPGQANSGAAAAPASGAPGSGRSPLDPALDLEAAWHAFATQQELEELRRRVGS